MSRARPFLALLLVLCSGAPLVSAHAAVTANAGEVEMSREVLASIQLAQQYLASRQRADGSFTAHLGEGSGIIGAAVLAWTVSGSLPGEGPFGPQVARGVDCILSSSQPSGLLFRGQHDRHVMYHHGLATLALAEVWGQTQDKRLCDRLKRAAELIVRCQNEAGGWRYQPKIERDADLSVTVIQLLALRAARDAGIAVPRETIERALRYVESCGCQEGNAGVFNGFAYQPGQGRKWSTTGAGVMSLMLCGQYKVERFKPALDFLLTTREQGADNQWFAYGNYYATQAMYQAGGQGESYRGYWLKWYPSIAKSLLARQARTGPERGRFDCDQEYGVWGTAMCVLILGLPYRYLPVYQR
jgi:hypothetical protein